MTSKLVIEIEEDWDECEDCGTYEVQFVRVLKDGVTVFEHDADGHLGGGLWYDWRDALAPILTALEYNVEIKEIENAS